jgi:hypothetical protein
LSPQFPSENTARQVVTSLWGIPRRQPWFPPVRALYLCLVSALYLSLAFAAYWPVLKYPAATLPAGKPTVGVVALFNAWTIWWNADRLANGLAGYWDAPIFWPEKGAFGLSEPQPLTLIVAPVVWLWGPVVAYHIYFLLNVWLNGLFAFLFCRRLKLSAGAAGFCGAYVVALPLIWQQPELLQYTPLWPVIWTWSCAVRLGEQVRAKLVAELGLAVGLTFAANLHVGFFSVMLLGASCPTLLRKSSWQNLAAIYAGGVLGVVLSMPIWMPVIRAVSHHGETRPLTTAALLSAEPGDWLCRPEHAVGSRILREVSVDRPLNPGWLRVLLAAIALAAAVTGKLTDRAARGLICLAAMGALAVLGSLGPNFRMFGFSPWETMYSIMPMFAWVRSPYRLAYLGQLAILVLSGAGLHVVGQLLGLLCRQRSDKLKTIRWAVPLLLGTVLAVEVWPPRTPLVMAPDWSDPPGWVRFLTNHWHPSRPILILDFPTGDRLIEYDRTVRAMLWQSRFRSPLVNGYSGFFPARWRELAGSWRAKPYGEHALRLLEAWGVELLVRPPNFPPPPKTCTFPYRLEILYKDPSGFEIYSMGKWVGSQKVEIGVNCE